MREVVSRCDICADGENVVTYRVSFSDEDWEVEICDKADRTHSKPIAVLIQKGRKRTTSATSTTRPALTALDSRVRGLPGGKPT